MDNFHFFLIILLILIIYLFIAKENGDDNNTLGNVALMAETAEPKNQRNGPKIIDRPKPTVYPARLNMGPCPPRFGRIMVLVIVVESSYKT